MLSLGRTSDHRPARPGVGNPAVLLAPHFARRPLQRRTVRRCRRPRMLAHRLAFCGQSGCHAFSGFAGPVVALPGAARPGAVHSARRRHLARAGGGNRAGLHRRVQRRAAGARPVSLGVAARAGGWLAGVVRRLLLRLPGDLPRGGRTDAGGPADARRRGGRFWRVPRTRRRRARPVRAGSSRRRLRGCQGAGRRAGRDGTRRAGDRRVRRGHRRAPLGDRPPAGRLHDSLGGAADPRVPHRLLGRRTLPGQVRGQGGLARQARYFPGLHPPHQGIVCSSRALGIGSRGNGAVLGG